MTLKDRLRTLMGIRNAREPLPPGPKPPIGSSIVRDKLRIRLKYPISDEQWEWFSDRGWRTISLRANRRDYTCVPDKLLTRLLDADELEREVVQQQMIRSVGEKHATVRRTINAGR